jgi:hypothetical protein
MIMACSKVPRRGMDRERSLQGVDTTTLGEPTDGLRVEPTSAHARPVTTKSWRLLLRTVSYVGPYSTTIALTVACSALYTLGRNGRAYLLKPLLDDAIPNADFALFLQLALLAVGIVLATPIAVFGRGYLTRQVLGDVMVDVRTALAA